MVLNSISANLVTRPFLFILSTNLSSFLSSILGVLSAVSLCRFTKFGVALSDSAVELVKLKSTLIVSFLLKPSLLLFLHFLLTFILTSSSLLFISISNVTCLSAPSLMLCLPSSLMSLSTNGSSSSVLYLLPSALPLLLVPMNLSSFSKTESITSGFLLIGIL